MAKSATITISSVNPTKEYLTNMTARKTILSILTIAMLAAVVVVGGYTKPTQAEDNATTANRFIRVTGTGSAAGAPDIAYMGIGVDSSDADINVALADNNSRIETIKAALGELGIASTDVRTDYFNIWQDKGYYEPMMGGEPPVGTFRINHTLVVIVRDASKVGQVLGTVIDAGANVVNYVNFDIADRGALEADARVDALADARDRAQQLADQIGAQLGEVVSVVEYSGSYYGPFYGGGGGGGGFAASNPPISEGTLSVNVQLEVTFSIQ